MAAGPLQRKYKVISLGEGRVGKTSIIHRLLGMDFDPLRPITLQSHFAEKTVDLTHKINGNDSKFSISLALWDTAGQERFHALAPIYYRDALCVIIVFDVTDRRSFERAKDWFDECMRILKWGSRKLSIAIVGNKIDLKQPRQVSYEEGIGLCKSLSDDEFFIMDTKGFGHKQYREKCQLLCDGYLRRSECALWSNSGSNYSFNAISSIFTRKNEQITFIPMDIYGLCFKFYFVGQKSTINYFETSAKTNEGINDMLESLIRTRVEIDYYHPPPRPRPFRRDQGDWIRCDEDIKYKEQPGGIWCFFSYVSDLLSSYL